MLVHAPVPGQVMDLADVPDPVFSGYLMGAGLGLQPLVTGPDFQPVVAPITGTLAKMMSHAFIVQSADFPEKAVMVHLGLDTVKLHGEGFTWEVTEGEMIHQGAPLGAWNPHWIAQQGLDPVCLVVAMQAPATSVQDMMPAGAQVAALDPLFTW